MHNHVYLGNLFNHYYELLTEKEKRIFSLHYLEDYSMSEIAEICNITRSRAGQVVKNVENKLLTYEKMINKEELIGTLNNLLEIKDIKKIKKEIAKIIESSTE